MIEMSFQRGHLLPEHLDGFAVGGQVHFEPRDPLFQLERLRQFTRYRADWPDCAATPAWQAP